MVFTREYLAVVGLSVVSGQRAFRCRGGVWGLGRCLCGVATGNFDITYAHVKSERRNYVGKVKFLGRKILKSAKIGCENSVDRVRK